ncbi:hypothetical protein ACH4EC_37720 [Streptomyces anulatus]
MTILPVRQRPVPAFCEHMLGLRAQFQPALRIQDHGHPISATSTNRQQSDESSTSAHQEPCTFIRTRSCTFTCTPTPELAGRVKAVALDTETGRLDVAPDLPAAGMQLRWSAPKLVAAANEWVQGANVRALHVLVPGLMTADPATAAAEPAPQPTAPATPEQCAAPPEGYREAIAAHRATWNPTRQHTTPEMVMPNIATTCADQPSMECILAALHFSPDKTLRVLREPSQLEVRIHVGNKEELKHPRSAGGRM